MNLKVDIESVDAVRRRLAVEVPASEVDMQLDAEYARLARDAQVPGFRPGHVPRHVLRQLFGHRIQAEVFERLIHDSLIEAIEKQGLEAIGRPELVTEQANPGAPLRYSAIIEVMPHLVVSGYADLEVERPIVVPREGDVDAVLQQLRESMAQLQPITDRVAVQRGDVVRISYEARVGERVVDRAEQRDVEVGAAHLPPDIERQIEGAAVGSELLVPTTHESRDAAGGTVSRPLVYRVRIEGLFSKVLPPLDDELAKDHGQCATLSELRELVRQRLERQALERADAAVRRQILEKLIEISDPAVPRALVERRIAERIEELRREAERSGRWPRNDMPLRERLAREIEPRAAFEVKVELLLEAIARQEAIAVSEPEIEQYIEAMVRSAGQGAEGMRASLTTAEARRRVRAQIVRVKAMDLVVQRARIRDVRYSSVADAGESG